MPRRRAGDEHAPRDYIAPGTGAWPHGTIDGPPWAHIARDLAIQVESAIQGQPLKPFARRAGVDVNVLTRLLKGEAWGDSLAMMKIACAADATLLSGQALQDRLVQEAARRLAEWSGVQHYNDPIETGDAWTRSGGPRTIQPTFFDVRSGWLLEGVALTTADHKHEIDAALTRFRIVEFASDLKPKVGLLLASRPSQELLRHLSATEVTAVWQSDGEFVDNQTGAVLLELRAPVNMARDGLEAWDRLRERDGVYTPSDLAKIAGAKAGNRSSYANDLIRHGQAFAVKRARTLYLPAYQFDSSGTVYPAVAPVLKAFRDAGWSDFSIAIWFATPTTWLSGDRPADLLTDEQATPRLMKAARRTTQA